MANSLGSLYIDITARTASLEQDMSRVKNALGLLGINIKSANDQMKSLNSGVNALGTSGVASIERLASRFVLYQLFRAVVGEVKHVIDNINNIPGIPAEAVTGINEWKIGLQEARNATDGLIASGLNFINNVGKTVGEGIVAGLYGMEAYEASTKEVLNSLDKIAAANDPGYYDKVRAAVVSLAAARKADAFAQLDTAGKIIQLRKDAAAQDKYAASSSIDSLQRTEAQAKAWEDLAKADKLHLDLKQQYETFARRVSTEEIRDTFTELSQKDKMLELEKKIGAAMAATGLDRPSVVGGGPLPDLTDEQLEKANKQFPQLLEWMRLYRAELQKVRSASMEWRDMTVGLSNDLDNLLTSLVTGGTLKIRDFLKSVSDAIIQTFFKLAVINPMLNMLFGSSKGWTSLATMFGGKADGGPARGLTLVGERGPELLNLGSGSTVIPNHAMVSGGGGGGMTVYMDARGADEARVAQMERNLAYLHATFERRVLGIAVNGKNRRGATGAALA